MLDRLLRSYDRMLGALVCRYSLIRRESFGYLSNSGAIVGSVLFHQLSTCSFLLYVFSLGLGQLQHNVQHTAGRHVVVVDER
jgi:hypothetical protein